MFGLLIQLIEQKIFSVIYVVIYVSVTRERWSAGTETGVMLNNSTARCSKTDTLIKSRVDASNSEINRGEFECFNEIVGEILPIGSIAYKLARISSGDSDATWSRGPKSLWDICAGVHLVKESGAVITDLDGNDFLFNTENVLVNGLIATNGQLFKQVFEMLLPYRDTART